MSEKTSYSAYSARALFVAGLIALTSVSTAQIYKVTDDEGNVSYTDRPPSETTGATVEAIRLNVVNTAKPPPTAPTTSTRKAPEQNKIEYSTEISFPEDGTTIPMGGGNFAVSAKISPPLARGEKLQLILDGAPLSAPQVSPTWQLTNVFRGEHLISIERVSGNGKVLDSAPPITVFVLRPGLRR